MKSSVHVHGIISMSSLHFPPLRHVIVAQWPFFSGDVSVAATSVWSRVLFTLNSNDGRSFLDRSNVWDSPGSGKQTGPFISSLHLDMIPQSSLSQVIFWTAIVWHSPIPRINPSSQHSFQSFLRDQNDIWAFRYQSEFELQTLFKNFTVYSGLKILLPQHLWIPSFDINGNLVG